jgi:hypothetical protein
MATATVTAMATTTTIKQQSTKRGSKKNGGDGDGGGDEDGDGLVFILAGAVCVVWEFAPVQTYACVGLYRFSTVSSSWLARKHKKPKNSLFSGYKKNSYCYTSQ